MKKGLVIILFLTMSLTGLAQQNVADKNEAELIELNKDLKFAVKKSSASSKSQAKVLKITRKKSNAIISIKAYRKSLQIKVKTVKLC